MRRALKPSFGVFGGVFGAMKFGLCEAAEEDDVKKSSYGVESTLLKPPGPLDSWDNDIKRFVQVSTHKGLKIDVSKPLSPNFMLRHSVQLGESHCSATASEDYSFTTQAFNESGVIVGTIHPMNGKGTNCLNSSKLIFIYFAVIAPPPE